MTDQEMLDHLIAENKKLHSLLEARRLREPTQAEVDLVASYETTQPLTTDTYFIDGKTTKRCQTCKKWVFGGPTICELCVVKEDKEECKAKLQEIKQVINNIRVLRSTSSDENLKGFRIHLIEEEWDKLAKLGYRFP